MSALAGRWNHDGRTDAGEACRKMLAAQEIYGPHDGAAWDGGDVALGRRLFRTLPEDAYDRQPLAGAGGRYRLIADVRLDNRDELAASLGLDATTAAGMADAAFLLAAWEKWGEDCFPHLLGDYAFALWDAETHRLILARDPIGMRPLHYHRGAGFFAFASMPKGLHALPDIPYAPDETRVAELLALLPESGPASYFEGISRVEPGQLAIVTAQGIDTRRHWNPTRKSLPAWTGGDPAEALRAELGRAVAARLRGGGGRVGAHLSGGMDSSAVAATAARLLAGGEGRVVAFTSVPREGYDGPAPKDRIGDEGPLAAATAALYPNMEHLRVRPADTNTLDGLDRDFFLLERPLLNACNQGWWNAINAEAKRRGIGVLLTGALGNMTISYGGMEALPELAAKGRLLKLLGLSRALIKRGHFRWSGALAAAFGPWMPAGLWKRLNRMRNGARFEFSDYAAINLEQSAALDMTGRARARGLDLAYRPRKNGFEARLWALRRTDQGNFQKAALAGWGVDLRDPTADRRLIEFCLSLPTEAFIGREGPGSLARRAFADRLPAAVLAERRKGLQAIDWHEALTAAREELRIELSRLENVPSAATALDLARMQALVEDWPSGDWNSHAVATRYRLALLRGIAGGHFLRKASRSNA
ncbi:MAG TPA: asparagine synthase-related protein [Allosphingosinicella sp.]|nr:asparagine synthase-related protein [Allosphingosinicella sp.]